MTRSGASWSGSSAAVACGAVLGLIVSSGSAQGQSARRPGVSAAGSVYDALGLQTVSPRLRAGLRPGQVPVLAQPRYLLATRAGQAPLREAGGYAPLFSFTPAARSAAPVSADPPLTIESYSRSRVLRGAQTEFGRATELYRLGRYRDAEAAFDVVLAVEPAHMPSRLGRVMSEVLRGRYEPALVDLAFLRSRSAWNPIPAGPGGELALRDRPEFDRQRQRLASWALRDGSEAAPRALLSVFLWIHGQTADALALTDEIRTRYPDSAYAGLGEMMRQPERGPTG